jgi:hypothetical protein
LKTLLRILLVAAVAATLPASLLAQNITGTVTNKTTGKPSAGDDVVLIKLANGMQEADRTKTDARGRFTLPVDDQGMHLVRVSHAKVPYFQPVPPGTTKADVNVYESSDKVEGVTGAADVMRLQTVDNSLEVTELFAVDNNSAPARTQFGAKAFEVYLPAQAEITSGAAMGPGGMPLQASPVPTGEPGHFAFVFPIRPGETRFQIVYKVPYTGKFTFTPRISVPMQNLAIMLPKSMKFDPAPGTAFQPVNDDVNAQVFLIKDATVAQPLGFTASGTGTMPKDAAGGAGDTATAAAGAEGAATPTPAAADNRPGGGLGNPIDTPDPLHKYRWWILGGIAVLFGAGIAFAMRKPTAPVAQDAMNYGLAPANAAASRRETLLQTLKEELFTLETDRLEGRVSQEQYAQLKAALETVLRHALQRTAVSAGASK